MTARIEMIKINHFMSFKSIFSLIIIAVTNMIEINLFNHFNSNSVVVISAGSSYRQTRQLPWAPRL